MRSESSAPFSSYAASELQLAGFHATLIDYKTHLSTTIGRHREITVASIKGTKPELHEEFPREQVGAPTGERFEFQYHQAAADALQVLDDTRVACVYCEWHDDYVIEAAGVASYRFHQVKTRSIKQGPWTVNEFFGIKRPRGRQPKKGPPKPGTADKSSIFSRLFDHVKRFGDRCEHFIFVTDNEASGDFESLLRAVDSATGPGGLTGDPLGGFNQLYAALITAFHSLTKDELFGFLKKLKFQSAMGKLADLKGCRILIAGRIREISEVDLKVSEAEKIGTDLVSTVRKKSHLVLKNLPTSTQELRDAKGLILDDVLKILSLSSAGYRELKVGGRISVVTLSRLHRLCKESGIDNALIPDLCRFKTSWDAWWIVERNNMNPLDQVALKQECANALRIHADGKLDFKGLHAEATALARKYVSTLTTSTPLTEELVFGQMLSLAVEAEL